MKRKLDKHIDIDVYRNERHRNKKRWKKRLGEMNGGNYSFSKYLFIYFKKDFIYLFMRDTGRRRSRLHAGTPIPGPRGHDLGPRQVLSP